MILKKISPKWRRLETMKLVSEYNPALRQKCQDVIFDYDYLSRVSSEMLNMMTKHNGIGLAAPQIGLNIRMFVMISEHRRQRICINPEILYRSEEMIADKEGCLSFPGMILKVERPKFITVRYTDLNNQIIEEEMSELKARCFAHELDHLNGICFTDLVPKVKLQMAQLNRRKRR